MLKNNDDNGQETVARPVEIDFYDLPLESPRIHLITGRPGQGKTVLDFSIADRLHVETGKPVYVAMTGNDRRIEKYERIPDYIHTVVGLDFPLDSIIIGDDWQRIIHARRGMSDINVLIDKMFATHRHDDIDYLIDSQTASSIDRNNVLRSNYRWFKAPLKLEMTLGRDELQPQLELAGSLNLGLDEAYLDMDYIDSETGEYHGLGDAIITGIPLPKYWTEELSVMHRRRPDSLVQKLTRII